MSALTDPSEIRRLLDAYGFRFSKSLGQNFLIDASVPERIADSVGADRECSVLEIGPGIGCLTAELSAKPTKLVCANLPYNITSPVLTSLIEADCFERICVMIQKEVAERICAGPGTKDYGAFGLFVQWYYAPELLFTVPPHCFMPQPKVTSAVIRLTKRTAPPAEVRDEKLLFHVIRAAFNQRRKTLTNALSAAGPLLSKSDCERILKLCDLDTNIRGEKLNLGDFARISNEITNFTDCNL